MASVLKSARDLIVGTVIGITAMLPGISGATMAVAFGIYERLIRDLAELRTYLIKDIRFILLVAIGLVIGTILCAKVLDDVLVAYPVFALMFFIGLIVGQLIPLYRDVREENGGTRYSGNDILSFVIGVAIMCVMIAISTIQGSDVVVDHDAVGIVLMVLVGMAVAVSALLPGLSHSTLLLACGLMTAFLDAVSNLDFFLLAPLALGAVAAVLVFSKIIHRALEDHHLTTLLFILGLTTGSILVIGYNAACLVESVVDVAGGIIAAAIGFAASLACARFDKSVPDEE